MEAESEFALAKFSSRSSPLTKAIGYDKSAMVFHMLRRQIGEDAFWAGLRDIFRQRLFRKTGWADLQAAFEQRAGRSLAAFFDQWVARKGAPRLRLSNIEINRTGPTGSRVIIGSIQQDEDIYVFPVTIRVHTAAGFQDHPIQIQKRQTDFKVPADDTPRWIELDPQIHLLRRLELAEIPPTVNSLKGGKRVAVVVSDTDSNIGSIAQTLAASLGFSHVTKLSKQAATHDPLPPTDILVVGRPPLEGQLSDLVSPHLKSPRAIRLDKEEYDRRGDVFFGVFRHPDAPERVIGFFWPLDAGGAAAARKITHYGKYSYLVFRNGRNIAKGTWPIENSPIRHRWQ